MEDARRTSTRRAVGLHVCPSCDSCLVQPTRWEQTRLRGRWRLWRRCPECEWRAEGVYAEPEIDAYDEELDLGTRALADELKEREQECMQWFAEAFSRALEADLISAEDFAQL